MTEQSLSEGFVTISKEELAALPAEEFSGEIRLIETTEQLEKALEILSKADTVGFDTETRPSFHKGQINKVALIQIALPQLCFLIRINKLGLSKELIDFFENPGIKKIGLSLKDDFMNLSRISDISPANCIDLQSFVKDYRLADNSLTKLYAVLFDKRISKGQRLTNWEADPLSPAQKQYAALDAAACLSIYHYLKKGNFSPFKSKYFKLQQPETESESQDTGESK